MRQAITDHLTGLLNRQGFEAASTTDRRRRRLRSRELACLFVDLDRFKWINDNMGHAAGDVALRRIRRAHAGTHLRRATCCPSRWRRICHLLPAEDAEKRAFRHMCGRLPKLFETPFGRDARLSASVGIAIYPRHAANAAELLQKSDIAMYAKKRDGKNGAQIFDNACWTVSVAAPSSRAISKPA